MEHGRIITIGSSILICIISFLISNCFSFQPHQILFLSASGVPGDGGGDPTPLPPNPPPPPPPGITF